MKTLETFFYPVLKSLYFGKQLLCYLMVFLSALFHRRASLGCELVALRSQLAFYKESIQHKKQPRPRFHPAFRLLWILLSRVWGGWKFVAKLMKPRTGCPWIVSALHRTFSRLSRRINPCISWLMAGRPPFRRDFHRHHCRKAAACHWRTVLGFIRSAADFHPLHTLDSNTHKRRNAGVKRGRDCFFCRIFSL